MTLHGSVAVTDDGSVETADGLLAHVSLDRFVDHVVAGTHCFVCCRRLRSDDVSEEHVLPRWILRRFDLFAKTVELPNGTSFRYDQYKVPCCAACNGRMGREIEEPISRLVEGGLNAVAGRLRIHGSWLFFTWLARIFLKTHLRDASLALSRDRRLGGATIGDLFDWSKLHHVHSVARAFYAHSRLHPTAHGTFLVLPADVIPGVELFDYADIHHAQTVMLRLGDIALFAVLDDACAVFNLFGATAERFTGPLSPLQLREVLAHLAFINLNLSERPRFHTTFDLGGATIAADLPDQLGMCPTSPAQFGVLLHRATKDIILRAGGSQLVNLEKQVLDGRVTFLFDDKGRFRRDSMEPPHE